MCAIYTKFPNKNDSPKAGPLCILIGLVSGCAKGSLVDSTEVRHEAKRQRAR